MPWCEPTARRVEEEEEKEGAYIQVIVEPFTRPPTHSRSVHTAPPFIPTSAVAFVEDELLVALGLAPELVAVALDDALELEASSPSSSWIAHRTLASTEWRSRRDPPSQTRLVGSLQPSQAAPRPTMI